MKHKGGKQHGLLQQVADPKQPWEELGIDFVVDLPRSKGCTVILTVVDLFSRHAHFIPCKGLPSARKLAYIFLHNIYRLHGVPRRIISDCGVQFTARFWRDFLHLIGCEQGLSSGYHPCTNGAAERVNALIKRYLWSYTKRQGRDWVELLPFAEVAYNNSLHTSTGYPPFKVVYGRDFRPIPEWTKTNAVSATPKEWIDRLPEIWKNVKKAGQEARAKYKEWADKKRLATPTPQVGSKVYLSTKYLRGQGKLGPKYIGPFPVTKIINPVTVQLRLPPSLGRVHPSFHISLLKPVVPPKPHLQRSVPEGHYEIDEILDYVEQGQTRRYLVHWSGYSHDENSWVEEKDIRAPRLLRRFHRAYRRNNDLRS